MSSPRVDRGPVVVPALTQEPQPRAAQPPQAAAGAPASEVSGGWSPLKKLAAEVDTLVRSFTPSVFRQGNGPDVDRFNATKNWMSDRAFNAGRPSGDVAALQGPMRVASGPLSPAPTLKRPVVMIPGLTMPAQSFDRMGDQLATNPANGPVVVYVAAQDTFRLGDAQGREATADELKKAKLFEVEFKDPWSAPTVKAPQIGRAMERIAKATGKGDVDVVTHSAGGTDFRLYLDQRDPAKGPKIQRAVMIGPASHGTQMGNIGAVVGNPIKNVDAASRELAIGSKMVNDLNKTWDRQKGQIPGGFTIIGTTGTPTMGPSRGAFEDGDGYMPTAQLPMPGAKVVLMEGPHKTPLAHLWQVQYSGVVNAAFDVLGS